MRELAKQYDPLSAEERWVRRWADEPFTADAARADGRGPQL